jgi:nitroimidazol reductase NimA-like FMN-containing flavoprotein (pyridoxamine 5'-phosphate oxidase superfamily)
MLVSELRSGECYELLARLGFGRLACARDNQPYIVPIYFAYEPHRLYGFGTLGQKIEWMRSNPLVAVEADEVKSHIEWTSVVVRGRYEEFPDRPEFAEVRKQAQSVLEKRSLWWQAGFAAAQTRGGFNRDLPVFYCIHIEDISGHRAMPDPVD